MKKTLGVALFLFLACFTIFGQTSYKGLTPGKSTRADVERVLGPPVKKVSATLVEYRPRPLTGKVFVQYRPASLVVERIEFLCGLPDSNCNDLMKSLNLRLPERAEETTTSVNRKYVAYSAAPFYVAETIDEDGEIVNDLLVPVRVAFYSRDLYESAVTEVKQANKTNEERARADIGRGLGAIIGAIDEDRDPSGAVLNDKAIEMPEPVYPPGARAVRASGMVMVQVTVDEQGRVIEAAAVSGHQLLRQAAVDAARRARFNPASTTRTGRLTYRFEPQ